MWGVAREDGRRRSEALQDVEPVDGEHAPFERHAERLEELLRVARFAQLGERPGLHHATSGSPPGGPFAVPPAEATSSRAARSAWARNQARIAVSTGWNAYSTTGSM